VGSLTAAGHFLQAGWFLQEQEGKQTGHSTNQADQPAQKALKPFEVTLLHATSTCKTASKWVRCWDPSTVPPKGKGVTYL
jgi:hypothetical protein